MTKKITKEKLSFNEAWNECATYLANATNAHCYLFLFNNFYNFIQKIQNVEINKIMKLLCALFACCNIKDEDWGGLLHHS